jgi:hypothetical protein
MQYCYSNFSSIEDVEKCPNRGGFRQKIKARGDVVVSTPSKKACLA